MHAVVNQDLCMGCGICATICPGCFQMKDDFKSHIVPNCDCNQEGCCQQAADACPVQAIEIIEEPAPSVKKENKPTPTTPQK